MRVIKTVVVLAAAEIADPAVRVAWSHRSPRKQEQGVVDLDGGCSESFILDDIAVAAQGVGLGGKDVDVRRETLDVVNVTALVLKVPYGIFFLRR